MIIIMIMPIFDKALNKCKANSYSHARRQYLCLEAYAVVSWKFIGKIITFQDSKTKEVKYITIKRFNQGLVVER